jgi:hypothetical protein
LLQRIYRSNLSHVREAQYTPSDGVYEAAFLHSDRPRIQGMVATLLELGFK